MSLFPLSGARKLRKIITFDLEWTKGKEVHSRSFRTLVRRPEVRLAGVYNPAKGYRWYRSVKDFLDYELTSENSGSWFFAHAGGLADINFLFECLVQDMTYSIEASFSGSSAVIVRIRRGKRTWFFIDSLWLIKGSLADIGKKLGYTKGDLKDFEGASLEELIEYNERDCVVLYKALWEFHVRIMELGGQLQMTLASCSMFLFRKKYLQRRISTSQAVNRIARKAYFASRVEPFVRECENAYYYDINSSFPYSMTFPCPGNLLRSSARLGSWNDESIFLAKAKVQIPTDQYFPPLPYRHENSVYFLTGQWENWFTSLDLQLLLNTGGKILKVTEVLWFEPIKDLCGYAESLYEARIQSENELDKYIFKILLNSLYGKFAESPYKLNLLVNPEVPPHPSTYEDPNSSIEMLFPGTFLEVKEVPVAHSHVPISVFITSRSRKILYEYMNSARPFYYCDTDGFCSSNPDVEVSDSLGSLKLEKPVSKGHFIRPKLYRLDDKVRAKGFTLKPDLDDVDPDIGKSYKLMDEGEAEIFKTRYSNQKFDKMLSGQDVEVRRFSRVKETFRRATDFSDVFPSERLVTKGLRFSTRDKRKWLPGGDSRPWDVKEIIGGA